MRPLSTTIHLHFCVCLGFDRLLNDTKHLVCYKYCERKFAAFQNVVSGDKSDYYLTRVPFDSDDEVRANADVNKHTSDLYYEINENSFAKINVNNLAASQRCTSLRKIKIILFSFIYLFIKFC
jgi:hypothetical protein